MLSPYFSAAAVLTDWLTFTAKVPYVNFTNFLWVFLGIHQLGFAWRDGKFAGKSEYAMRILDGSAGEVGHFPASPEGYAARSEEPAFLRRLPAR